MPVQSRAVQDLPISDVSRRCHEETVRFLNGHSHDPAFCLELFRRAIVLQDQEAWSLLYRQYTEQTALVYRWIRQHPRFASCGLEADTVANAAFARMWRALTPERFAAFPDLKSILRYLQMCIASVILDSGRASAHKLNPTPFEELPLSALAVEDPQDIQTASDLWAQVRQRLRDDDERLVILCRFGEGMKPREIYEAYAERFHDVTDIYRILQRVLNRLRRDDELRSWYDTEY